MARIRTVKPEFIRNYELYELEMKYGLPLRLAFQGIWLIADREGRFKWDPRVIKLDALPFDEINFSDVMNILLEYGFIRQYIVDQKLYGDIPGWFDHQNIPAKEAQSRIPSGSNENYTVVTKQLPSSYLAITVVEKEREREREEEGEKEFSAEPKKKIGSTIENENDKIFIKIDLCGKDKIYPVLESQILEWKSFYPGIDVDQELRNLAAWNLSNPTRRKTKTGILRHINSWLSSAQNKSSGNLALSTLQRGSIVTPRKMTPLEMYHAHKFEREKNKSEIIEHNEDVVSGK